MKSNAWVWFTIIELLIVITIIGVISLATYMPYSHHQKKTSLSLAIKELSQSLNESRNLSIHGLDTGWWNVYVWLHIVPWSQSINYYTSTWWLDISRLPAQAYKTKLLPTWVEFLSVNGDETTQRLFTFAPITWSWTVSWISDDIVYFTLSYKWATSPVLQKELKYYRKSFISDY